MLDRVWILTVSWKDVVFLHDYRDQTAFAALKLQKQKKDQQDLTDVATVWTCLENKQNEDISNIAITKMQPPRAFEYAYHFIFYKQMEKICYIVIYVPFFYFSSFLIS